MDLQNRITKIVDYFRGLDVKGGLYIIKIEYPQKWGVIQDEKEIIKVAKSETSTNEYFYYGKLNETNIDNIFDLVEATITMNISAEAKIELMRKKVEELKELFGKHSLDELKNLKLVIEEKKKKTAKPKKSSVKDANKPKRKYVRKKKENAVESNIETVEKETEVVNA